MSISSQTTLTETCRIMFYHLPGLCGPAKLTREINHHRSHWVQPLHLTNAEMVVQGGSVNCVGLHSRSVVGRGLELETQVSWLQPCSLCTPHSLGYFPSGTGWSPSRQGDCSWLWHQIKDSPQHHLVALDWLVYRTTGSILEESSLGSVVCVFGDLPAWYLS